MADENFTVNLIRMLAAELHFQNVLSASREMFGKGYFALGIAEKAAVDQAVLNMVGSNYRDITPEFLGQAERQPVGFGIPKPEPEKSS
jgi:hypothetical protein